MVGGLHGCSFARFALPATALLFVAGVFAFRLHLHGAAPSKHGRRVLAVRLKRVPEPQAIHVQSPLWAMRDGVGKPSCGTYFGDDVNRSGLLITVVDIDTESGIPMVHKSGPFSQCYSPTPEIGTHRYVKAYYSRCLPIEEGWSGQYMTWVGQADRAGRFNRKTGVLNACAGEAKFIEYSCWKPPARLPSKVLCPGAMTSQARRDKTMEDDEDD
eukprot:CAMPEP_0117573242 /NCGR_PEP_ID=MMETSP0784-20121206/60842_1 /TAXON_ID=39447 /ORGANISM="" /LENGTH=213 /DNA_ID=CAMNT_0005371779 /DNA_START=16 /DNA_END=657 /DNA_ORIENTATION=-